MLQTHWVIKLRLGVVTLKCTFSCDLSAYMEHFIVIKCTTPQKSLLPAKSCKTCANYHLCLAAYCIILHQFGMQVCKEIEENPYFASCRCSCLALIHVFVTKDVPLFCLATTDKINIRKMMQYSS